MDLVVAVVVDQEAVETLVGGVAWRATNDLTSGLTRWGASSFTYNGK